MVSRIYLVALMGRENNPLYVCGFGPETAQSSILRDPGSTGVSSHDDSCSLATAGTEVSAVRDTELRYQFLAHISLDVFAARAPQKTSDSDFGLLFVQDGMAMYGWMTNTAVKIVLGFASGEVIGSEIRSIFRAIHFAYISLVCNPFYSVDERRPIRSRKFDINIRRIVDAWNGTTPVFSPAESISRASAASQQSTSNGSGASTVYYSNTSNNGTVEGIVMSYSGSRSASPTALPSGDGGINSTSETTVVR
ncbi:Sedlin, N-terminal conserved region-domain-containing protein [Lipomyces tetrasporus]|uniref:Sedlin, N-terminal conserved region-domain-containing protein n=1 Tax=Lipomyces tetrasporus TaxID=54092 RepID=A0AAD7QPW2_9ASCO|nr:Sedlin, N-terminal conserved region-domain-containing protein [Lipomyces tetrasporus]KAJ8099417.1 Sedlin, N-terminal conserved region-domain-containing protein [Lipomyces tetrasporus]